MKATNQTITLLRPSVEFLKNPYDFYDQLRTVNTIYRGYKGWYVTGYEEVIQIIGDKRFTTQSPLSSSLEGCDHLRATQKRMMLFQNGADHHRLRTAVGQYLSPVRLKAYQPIIEKLANSILDPFSDRKHMDIVADYAFPLASRVIATILGIDEKETYRFKEWTPLLIKSIDFSRSGDTLQHADTLVHEATDFLKYYVRKKKSSPQNDIISKLVFEEVEGRKLSEEELISTCLLLIVAGHETTVNLISNSLLLLHTHPQQGNLLRKDSNLITSAVEECLRYESPTQLIARWASEEIKLNHITFKKGDQINLLLGAANRDFRAFSRPSTFDITRNPNNHVAFGRANHFCLGSQLARMETNIALQVFLKRFNKSKLALNEPEWQQLFMFRSLTRLPIHMNG